MAAHDYHVGEVFMASSGLVLYSWHDEASSGRADWMGFEYKLAHSEKITKLFLVFIAK